MKKYIICIVSLAALTLCLSSCKKDEVVYQKPTGLVVGVVDSAAYSPSEFADAVIQNPFFSFDIASMTGGRKKTDIDNAQPVTGAESLVRLMINSRTPILDSIFKARVGTKRDGSRLWHIETYTFTYNTVSMSGKPLTLSGRVTFPNNTIAGRGHELSTLTLFSHQYLNDPSWAPYYSLSTMTLRTFYNSAVIEPDFQDAGYDQGKHRDGVLSFKSNARILHDCVKAALEIMCQHGVTLAADGYSTNWGHSAASGVAIAYARYYEMEATESERQAIKLRSTFAGEGPTNPIDVIKYGAENPDFATRWERYYNAFSAIEEEMMHGYKLSDFAPDWMNNTIVEYEGGTMTFFEARMSRKVDREILLQYYPENYNKNDIKMYFASDMFDSEGHFDMSSPKTVAFFEILGQQSNMDDYVPTTDIYLAHAKNDNSMPYAPARKLYEDFKAKSPTKLHWLEVPAVEFPSNVHDLLSAEAMFYMAIVREPKDMARFYAAE